MDIERSLATILFRAGVIAFGGGLIFLARWSRRRNSPIEQHSDASPQERVGQLFLRPRPIETSSDLYFGTLAKGFSILGRVLIIVALVVAGSFILIAAYAILQSK